MNATDVVWFDGKKCSREWAGFLLAARKAGCRARLTSGKRTLAEQWVLYRRYRAGVGNLAAFPNPNAPHIRARHALDVGPDNRAVTELIGYGARHDIYLRRTVRGEWWHVESSSPLGRFLQAAPPTVLRYRDRGRAVARLQRRLRHIGFRSVPMTGYYGRLTRRAVRRFQWRHGMKVDGIAGPRTLERIYR